MTTGETGVVRWLFSTDWTPTSETQADELARGIFHHELTPTPATWHPSLGAALEDDIDFGITYETPDATVIEGPWLR